MASRTLPVTVRHMIGSNRLAGEQGGVDLWEAVGRRFAAIARAEALC